MDSQIQSTFSQRLGDFQSHFAELMSKKLAEQEQKMKKTFDEERKWTSSYYKLKLAECDMQIEGLKHNLRLLSKDPMYNFKPPRPLRRSRSQIHLFRC